VAGEENPWRIVEDRLLKYFEEMELPEWRYGKYVAALRRYRDLYQARQDTWEGNSGRAIEKLGNIPDDVAGFIRAAAYDKLYHVAWLVKRLAKEGKRVMVYAKFRQSANRLQRVLWDEYNMLVETFMGGDPPSKLADLKEKARVVMFMPVALEGVDLPEFDCLAHISVPTPWSSSEGR
jgi:tetratricopeptide (TPR) repeat protein